MAFSAKREFRRLSPTEIKVNPYQPRQRFTQGELDALADSIRRYGIITPLTVRRTDGGYELIAGERRLRCARQVGLATVPCFIVSADGEQSCLMALLENLQREDLDCFEEAEIAKGYKTENRQTYVLGVDVAPIDGDFGFCLEKYDRVETDGSFIEFIKKQNVDGVFVGHVHKNTTCISYNGITWTFGLKSGQYDYHVAGSLGGTLVMLMGDDFTVTHIPSLVPFAPMPSKAKMFENFFA